ncbi:CRE-FLP-12 protein [Ditylenchus destructor]|nr:CRE-FLP-12 protein [Ditylenchus destructor]
MNGFSIQNLFSLLLVCVFSSFAVCAQKSLPGQKGAPEYMESNPVTFGSESEILSKVEAQLFGALQLLQAYEEAAPIPAKFAEKRRNKFEFIRFGRRRR